jgi:arylsulfatase A-like enzyme
MKEDRPDDGYAEFHWSHNPSPIWPTNEYQHWLREKGIKYETNDVSNSKHVKTSMPPEHHQTIWCAEKAVNFIQANESFEKPWLFSVNLFDPHHPFDPPEGYLDRYLNQIDKIPLPNYSPGELENKPIFQKQDHQSAYSGESHRGKKQEDFYSFPSMSEKEHRLVRAAYWAMVDLVDDAVGRMLQALVETNQREETLVIFTSDHGEMLGDHGIYLKGPYFYDPAIRVPLIISWPNQIPQNFVTEELVELVDIAPTLLDITGCKPDPGMQGKSLWPLLNGEHNSSKHRKDIYCEYYNAMTWHSDPAAYATMVRTKKYKLVQIHGEATGELYDLDDDPGENINQWDNHSYRSVKMNLLQRLADRMAQTVDPIPERGTTY